MPRPALHFDDLQVISRMEQAIARRERTEKKKLPPKPRPAKRRGIIPATFSVPYIPPAKVYAAGEQTTFHFAHSYITNDFAGGSSLKTTGDVAQAHDDYINREDAPEELATDRRVDDPEFDKSDMGISAENPELARYADYLDDGDIDRIAGGTLAFGTIGETREQRRKFWRAVSAVEPVPKSNPGFWIHPRRNSGFWNKLAEMDQTEIPTEIRAVHRDLVANRSDSVRIEAPPERVEALAQWAEQIGKSVGGYNIRQPSIAASLPRGGRIQMRLIIELPHEVSPIGRYMIAREFCKSFEERGLPYWAVGHKPAPFGDQRNYHLHIAYYDRPCAKLPDGRWDIEDRVVSVAKSGKVTVAYPHLQNKDREAQGKPWMLHLRQQYADAANRILSKEGHAKRYTPKSYKDLGISKIPGRHISQAAFNLERQGVATEEGRHNRMAQILWAQTQHQAAIDAVSKDRLTASAVQQKQALDLPGAQQIAAKFMPAIEQQERIAITSSRQAVSALVETDSLGGYARSRSQFFRTVLSEMHERSLSRSPVHQAGADQRHEYARISQIIAEARGEADTAEAKRLKRKADAEQHLSAARSATDEVTKLTEQFAKEAYQAYLDSRRDARISDTFSPVRLETNPGGTSAERNPERLDTLGSTPSHQIHTASVSASPPAHSATASIGDGTLTMSGDGPSLTKPIETVFDTSQVAQFDRAKLLSLSFDQLADLHQATRSTFSENAQAQNKTAAAAAAQHLNSMTDIAHLLGHDLSKRLRSSAPISGEARLRILEIDLPITALAPELRRRLGIPANAPAGMTTTQLAANLKKQTDPSRQR